MPVTHLPSVVDETASVDGLTAAGERTKLGLASVASSGSATDLSSGTLNVNRLPSGIPLANLQTITNGCVLGNVSAGLAVPTTLSPSDVATFLGLATVATSGNAGDLAAGTLPAGRMPAFTGDVTTSVGTVANTIASSAVTNAKMANMADQTFKGNVSGGSAAPSDLTVSQMATALKGTSSSTLCVGNDSRLTTPSNANLTAIAGLTTAASLIDVWTGSGTAALDDWDRTSGTWTPVIEGQTTAGTHTYQVQVGRYFRRGKMVFVFCRCQVLTKNSSGSAMAGNIQIGGLPFTSVNNSNEFGVASFIGTEHLIFTTYPGGVVNPNSTKIVLYKHTSGTTGTESNMTAASDVGAQPQVILTAFYEAA